MREFPRYDLYSYHGDSKCCMLISRYTLLSICTNKNDDLDERDMRPYEGRNHSVLICIGSLTSRISCRRTKCYCSQPPQLPCSTASTCVIISYMMCCFPLNAYFRYVVSDEMQLNRLLKLLMELHCFSATIQITLACSLVCQHRNNKY